LHPRALLNEAEDCFKPFESFKSGKHCALSLHTSRARAIKPFTAVTVITIEGLLHYHTFLSKSNVYNKGGTLP
jgi:hypothetical protein